MLEIGLYDLDDRRQPRLPIITGSACPDLNPARTTFLVRGVPVAAR